MSAAHGFSSTRTGKCGPVGQTIRRIEASHKRNNDSGFELFALWDDGTIWRRRDKAGSHFGVIEDGWEQVELDDLPENRLKEAFMRADPTINQT